MELGSEKRLAHFKNRIEKMEKSKAKTVGFDLELNHREILESMEGFNGIQIAMVVVEA